MNPILRCHGLQCFLKTQHRIALICLGISSFYFVVWQHVESIRIMRTNPSSSHVIIEFSNSSTADNASSEEPTTRPAIIDLVITYVNGSTAQFQQNLAETRTKYGKELPPFSANYNRFKDNDDLRFLFRSIDTFASIFNRIFLVVADENQIPLWLNTSERRVKIVFHRDIWYNMSELPNFNSLAIESNLHHIRGLSELYVYCNDDFFFASPALEEDFFKLRYTQERVIVENILIRPSSYGVPLKPRDRSDKEAHYLNPTANSLQLILAVCGDKQNVRTVEEFAHFPQHAPYVFAKSVMEHAESIPSVREALERSWRSRFRTGEEINVVHFFSNYVQCGARLRVRRGDQKDIIFMHFDEFIQMQNYEKLVGKLMTDASRILRPSGDVIRPKYVCINDDTSNSTTMFGKSHTKLVYLWRETLFPTKSSFEI